MRLSIFARLILSYLVLFSLLAGVSLFFIYHLSQFNRVIQSIVSNDTAVLEFSNQLSDAFLSESRHDRKFVVLNDEQLYKNYLKSAADFNLLLSKALQETTVSETKALLHAIDDQHRNFSRLVMAEMALMKEAKPYAAADYAQEKQKIANAIMSQLKTIQQDSEKNVFSKIRLLRERGNQAGKIAIMIALLSLLVGLIVAVIITRSITTPLNAIKAKTTEIAQGNFQGDLVIDSPPTITELAEAINSMCHKLQEVDAIKSNFFSHMSHELRTPLASIKEGTKILLDGLGGELSEKQQRILAIITQESNRMIILVNSLLDLAKMEAGMTAYHFTPTDPASLMQEALQELMPLAEAKSIAITNQMGSLPAVKLDRERVMLVFRNIIGNAIKFTPDHGQISIAAAIKDKFLEIAVRDNGIGISRKDLDRIFLKFQQVIPTKGEKTQGTGLGLAMVKQIILAHGGKVWAESQEGDGSTFYISLPLSA
ncbi:MAG: HAMP domain-containing protein [Proteobacteria bacterium]|nr:HAMP domain-containing protein [Pseudomonadota bacterium]MBU1714202.1 HAMP domain-containing protein [Pseudomonadota bacterium]